MKKNKIFVIAFILVIFDQGVKFFIRRYMSLLDTFAIIPNFFSITYIENKGAAWGIFGDATFFLIFVSLLVFYLLLKFVQEEKNWNWVKRFSISLLFGGLVGNLIDRIFYRSVTDYLAFNLFGYHFPVFNLADILIVVGTFLVIFSIIRSEKYECRSK